MRKLIGTIVIVIFLWVGFFGCERYDIKPFIIEWFKSDGPNDLGRNMEKASKKIKKTTDSVLDKSDEVINDIVNEK